MAAYLGRRGPARPEGPAARDSCSEEGVRGCIGVSLRGGAMSKVRRYVCWSVAIVGLGLGCSGSSGNGSSSGTPSTDKFAGVLVGPGESGIMDLDIGAAGASTKSLSSGPE